MILNYKAKLDHYNAWLMDPTRELTAIYPGFDKSNEINELDTHTSRTDIKPKKIKELAVRNRPVALSTGASTMDTSVENTHMTIVTGKQIGRAHV